MVDWLIVWKGGTSHTQKANEQKKDIQFAEVHDHPNSSNGGHSFDPSPKSLIG